MNTELQRNRHALYNLNYHLVVVTKYRHQCITAPIMDKLKEIVARLLADNNGELVEFNGEADHIHVLFTAPPHLQLSSFVNNLKTVTARLVRKEYGEYLRTFYWEPVFWSRSYCLLSTGGATIDVIKKYIESQGQDKNSSCH